MKNLKLFYVVPAAIFFLIFLAFKIQEVPFRGEHWAMLYAWTKNDDWFSKLSQVINIEYFGDHRFQPLNSSPMILGYSLFGVHFLPYYLVSIGLHLLLAFGVLRLGEAVRGEKKVAPLDLIKKSPLEFSLFLVLFSSFEVIFWTYFHYIQIATVLGVFALGWYIRNENPSERVKAYLAVVFAALFYEPYLCELGVFFLMNLRDLRKKEERSLTADIFLPLTLLVLIGLQYVSSTASKPVSAPPDVSEFNGILLQAGHKDLFEAPGAFYKPFFLLYNLFLLVVHVFKTFLLPSYANRTNIYEMVPLPISLEARLPFLIGAFFVACWFLSRLPSVQTWIKENTRAFGLLAFISLVIPSVIIWGRPGAGHYASVQFRYGFVILPFLFVLFLEASRRFLKSRTLYLAVLAYLMVVNLGSSYLHSERLVKSFAPLAKLIEKEKREGKEPKKIVTAVSKALMDYSIPAPGHDMFLIYNGRGGFGRFYP